MYPSYACNPPLAKSTGLVYRTLMTKQENQQISMERGWGISLGVIALMFEISALGMAAEVPDAYPATVAVAVLGGAALFGSAVNFARDYRQSTTEGSE